MQWSELKQLISYVYAPYVDKGFVNADSGSPTELAYLAHLVNMQIAGFAQDFDFEKVTGTLTLTGASSYNLKTLLPDLRSVYQMYGINENQDHPYLPNDEANITAGDGWTIKNKTLYFTGNAPASGTASLLYKSNYLVINAAGTRKRLFEADDDESVLDEADIPVLVYGVGEFINWKANDDAKAKRQETHEKFLIAWDNLTKNNMATNQLSSMI